MYFWIWMSPDSLRMGGQGKERGEERVIRELCCQPIFSCLHFYGGKPHGTKHRPLSQLGHSWTLCATRKTKTYWTVNITWLITLFSPLVNFSSLFSCLALWNTKGNVSPGKLGIMTFWARQLLVSGHTTSWCLKPQIFSFSLCLFSSVLFFTTLGIEAILCSVFFTASIAISHNWEISDLEKASNYIHISKYQDALSKGNRENKFYFLEI